MGVVCLLSLDYDDTFVSVVKIKIVRTLLSIVAFSRQCLYLMNVETTFLHGNLDECIHMTPSKCLFFLYKGVQA